MRVEKEKENLLWILFKKQLENYFNEETIWYLQWKKINESCVCLWEPRQYVL